ncbi:MAG: surface-adhesin E family protein [Thermodesulfobacteriota bacterium]
MKYSKFISLLIFTMAIGCSQKNSAETPVVENVPQSESNSEPKLVVVQVSDNTPEGRTVIGQITAEPKKEDTAVTYPKVEKIKKYKSTIKEDTWLLIGGVTGERPYSVFIDPETIQSEKGLVTSWSKLKFEKSQLDDDGLSYKSVQINSAIDCDKRTYSYTDSKFYDFIDRLVESQPAPYEAQPIVDGTVSATIADFVCGYELNKPK